MSTDTATGPAATWSDVIEQARFLLALKISDIPVPRALHRPAIYVSRRIVGKDYLAKQRASDARHDEWKALEAAADDWSEHLTLAGRGGPKTVEAAQALVVSMLPAMHSGTLSAVRLTTGDGFTVNATVQGRILSASIESSDDDNWTGRFRLVPGGPDEDITVTHVGEITEAVFTIVGSAFRI